MRVLFFGSPEFAEVSLRALVGEPGIQVVGLVTQPDRPFGRGQELRASPIKVFAQSIGIPVFQPLSIRKDTSGFIAEISKLGAFDIGVVIAFGQILPKEVLSLPRCGCVNVHGSLLPRWRGAAPIQRAIEAGDPETGVCLMQMEEGLDTGPVYSRATVGIDEEESSGQLMQRLAKLGAELLVKDIPQILSGKLVAAPQSENGITYAKKILSTEALIDWTQPANILARKIRAFNPAPGAFTMLVGKRVKVFSAAAKGQLVAPVAPGTVTLLEKQALEVQTGDGVLSITELQLEGKKRATVNEFVAGNLIALGAVLGNG